MNILMKNFLDDLINLQLKHGYYLDANQGYNPDLGPVPVSIERIEIGETLECRPVDDESVIFTPVKF